MASRAPLRLDVPRTSQVTISRLVRAFSTESLIWIEWRVAAVVCLLLAPIHRLWGLKTHQAPKRSVLYAFPRKGRPSAGYITDSSYSLLLPDT